MLVTFSCSAHSDIIMLGDIAKQLIKMMGHSGTMPSAIAAEDVANRLAYLKKSLDAHQETPLLDEEYIDEEKTQINLSTSAFPLIEMLEAAIEDQCPVMWHQS